MASLLERLMEFNKSAYYDDMSRLFKAGPIARQRIANKIAAPGQTGMPVGTARAFLRQSNTAYTSTLASYGQYNRMARYADYNEMESMAELNSGLDIYADEVCSKNEEGDMLKIDSTNPDIKRALYDLFYEVLNLDFKLWYWVRSACKYGDYFLLVDHHPDYGVLNLIPIPVNEIEREEGFSKENPLEFRYRWITQGNRIIEPWQVIHFRLMGNDNFMPYGASILEAARRVWRQLILMEDAVMVYRIVRSPERRVFYIGVGNVAPQDIPQFMNTVQTQLKRNQVIDSTTGRVDLRYNPMSVDEDYWVPVRGEGDGTKIDTLPGGQFTGDIDDLVYIQNKLFAALKIPKSYLGYEGDINAKSTLSQEDVRFARTIQRIQKVFISELNKIAMIHLHSMGFQGDDIVNFEISMANPSSIAELQKLELWRTRFEVASVAQEGLFDRDFVYTKLWKLSPEEIEGIKEGKRRDRLFDLELDALQTAASTAPAAGEADQSAALPPPPGEEGQPGQAAGIEQTNDGKDPNQQIAAPNELIKPFPGKKKSKKLMPDLKNYVFNIAKTAMDPKRNRSEMERFKSAPFGEHHDTEEKIFNARVATLRKFAEDLEKIEVLNKTPHLLSELTDTTNE